MRRRRGTAGFVLGALAWAVGACGEGGGRPDADAVVEIDWGGACREAVCATLCLTDYQRSACVADRCVCTCDPGTCSAYCLRREMGSSTCDEDQTCRCSCPWGRCDGDAGPDGPAECSGPDGCAPDELCETEVCGGIGVCRERRSDCEDPWWPVCGCDDVSYDNDCARRLAGTARQYEGLCGSWAACGGSGGGGCSEAERCNVERCDGASGRCMEAPAACPDGGTPACGCDGVTYVNDCERLLQGAALDHRGAC